MERIFQNDIDDAIGESVTCGQCEHNCRLSLFFGGKSMHVSRICSFEIVSNLISVNSA